MTQEYLEKLRKCGHPDQLLQVRRITLQDGRSEGCSLIEIQNAAGLYLTIAESNGMDLYDARYKGVNLCYKSKTGLVHNRYFNNGSEDFCHYWPGGMMYTCGLTQSGGAVTEDGQFFPSHGRCGMLPAENVSIEKNEKGVWVRGEIHDSAFKGTNLILHRSYFIPADGARIELHDTLENAEALPAEYMLLYHCNFGYPLLDEGVRVQMPEGELLAACGDAADACRMTAPRDDKEEELFTRRIAGDAKHMAETSLFNKDLGFGAYVRYSTENLPYMLEWKNMNSHDYVLGLEPTATRSRGRLKERAEGTLPVLGAYESRDFFVEIGIRE